MMKKTILYGLALLGLTLNISAQSPVKKSFKTLRSQDVICPADFHDAHSVIHAPQSYKKLARLQSPATKTSEFEVEYIGFPEDAKVAFERAVDIWEYLIQSDVPIRVIAYWEALGSNILGSANTTDFLINFEGAPKVNTYYPIALAEKLAGKPLNNDVEFDIYCRFSSQIPWHYGEAKDITSGKFDLTSIVLHELGHGLGFISTMSVSAQRGSYGYGTPYKTIYDAYIEDVTGNNLVDTSAYTNNTADLYRALTGNGLYFDISVDNTKPKLYAPTSFSSGSSISHLDDYSYLSGTENSLMTSTARSMEVAHDPGPLAMGIFEEMGWKSTSIVHQELKNFTSGSPVTFEATLRSDSTLNVESFKLYYKTNNGEWQSIDLENISGNTYAHSITFPNGVNDVQYYFEYISESGNSTISPGNDGVSNTSYYYSFDIGTDTQGPAIYHTPFQIQDINSELNILALAEDDFNAGIESVVVNYAINGKSGTLNLELYNEDTFGTEYSQGINNPYSYLSLDAFPNLSAGDQVTYQIVATDKSGNKTTLPTQYQSTSSTAKPVASFYSFTVTSLLGVVNSYESNFENADNDFALTGFSITEPEGFNSKGLHSSHPYQNGLGLLSPEDGESVLIRFEKDEIAMLRYALSYGEGTSTLITFDEVVMVEPGTDYEAEMYDYVAVETSLDDGETWDVLEASYDSRKDSQWLALYEGDMSTGEYANSETKGNIAMTRKRNLVISSGLFNSLRGEPMLLRFRLYSDQFSYGWGWSIDNLYVQALAPVITANEKEPELCIFPNPTSERLDFTLQVSKPQTIKAEIFTVNGIKVYEEESETAENSIYKRINIAALSSGTYVLKVKDSSGVRYKRFVKI